MSDILSHSIGNYKIKILKNTQILIIIILNFIIKIFFPRLNLNENQIIISRAFYAPWKKDKKFKTFFKTISKFTLLDDVRAYTLWALVKNVRKEKGLILDIGCMMGGSSFIISKSSPHNKIIAYDTFEGFKDNDKYYKKNFFIYKDIKNVILNSKLLKLKNLKIVKGYFPTKKSLNYNKIKFAHVDVNTYNSTKKIFFYLKKRIIKNGIIVFDDYGIYGNFNVTFFLDKIKNKFNHEFHFVYNFMGQCILIKKT